MKRIFSGKEAAVKRGTSPMAVAEAMKRILSAKRGAAKDVIPSPIEAAALTVVVVLWIALNTSLFGKEIKAAVKIPVNLSMTVEEKKLAVDGPVYRFASELILKTPPDAALLFLYENLNRFKKTVYYTYPRRITPVNNFDDIKDSDILKNGYLAVYLNEGVPSGKLPPSRALLKLDGNPLLNKISGADNWAIYKVTGGGIAPKGVIPPSVVITPLAGA